MNESEIEEFSVAWRRMKSSWSLTHNVVRVMVTPGYKVMHTSEGRQRQSYASTADAVLTSVAYSIYSDMNKIHDCI